MSDKKLFYDEIDMKYLKRVSFWKGVLVTLFLSMTGLVMMTSYVKGFIF